MPQTQTQTHCLSYKLILFCGLNVVSSMVLRHGSLVCESCCAMHLHNPSRAVFADNKKAEAKASAVHLVAPTGFEPATFALRGRRPKPLDDGAIKKAAKHVAWVKLGSSDRIRTGDLRLERATS